MANWQSVFNSANPHQAAIVKDILEERELYPILVNKRDSNYHLGSYEVQVAPDHVIRALKIIEDEIKF
ncbi:MAG: hypothetical protein HC842_02190 [Cytophagales bacterium]|nr:hypothetical protein [Cytophagales bacterium]